jgi:hypothetical protein
VVVGREGELRSDARFGCARYAESKLRGYTLLGARYLRAGGQLVFSAADSADVSLDFTGRGATGFVRGPETGYTLALAWEGEADSVRFEGVLRRAAVSGGFLRLELAGAGNLRALRTEAAAAPSPSADFDQSGTVDFGDFFLFADAFGQTDARFDLDQSGTVDFGDFFLFADAFGRSPGAD